MRYTDSISERHCGTELIALLINVWTFVKIHPHYSFHTGLITTHIPNSGQKTLQRIQCNKTQLDEKKGHRCAEHVRACLKVTERKLLKTNYHYISLIIWKCYLKSKHVICQRQVEELTSSPQVTQLKLHQTQKHQIPSSHTNSTSVCRCLEMRVMARANNRSYSQRISFTNGWPVWHFYLLLFLTPLPPHLRLFHFIYEEYPEEAILH